MVRHSRWSFKHAINALPSFETLFFLCHPYLLDNFPLVRWLGYFLFIFIFFSHGRDLIARQTSPLSTFLLFLLKQMIHGSAWKHSNKLDAVDLVDESFYDFFRFREAICTFHSFNIVALKNGNKLEQYETWYDHNYYVRRRMLRGCWRRCNILRWTGLPFFIGYTLHSRVIVH